MAFAGGMSLGCKAASPPFTPANPGSDTTSAWPAARPRAQTKTSAALWKNAAPRGRAPAAGGRAASHERWAGGRRPAAICRRRPAPPTLPPPPLYRLHVWPGLNQVSSALQHTPPANGPHTKRRYQPHVGQG